MYNFPDFLSLQPAERRPSPTQCPPLGSSTPSVGRVERGSSVSVGAARRADPKTWPGTGFGEGVGTISSTGTGSLNTSWIHERGIKTTGGGRENSGGC